MTREEWIAQALEELRYFGIHDGDDYLTSLVKVARLVRDLQRRLDELPSQPSESEQRR